jgi:EAL domain-containing protein (putative c-di-GMP-specific phosphodiesterase class I)/FixJ family two-component response regulator
LRERLSQDARADAESGLTMDISELERVRTIGVPAGASAIRLLVVEDSLVQRSHLVKVLHTVRGCTVLEAENGKSALAEIENAPEPVDVVICDLAMPEMDGMAFIRHLASIKPTPALIIVSSQPLRVLESVEVMAKAHGLRTLGIVEKPALKSKLLPLLERYEAVREPHRTADAASRIPVEEITEALKQGQFYPLFQPKVELATGKVTGAEALARWRRPGSEVIAPASFLPVIEAHGLIDELTWTMIDQAAAACREWHRHGLPISVAVNLSLATLTDPNLALRISERVLMQGLLPRHMILEVTEQAAVTDVAQMLETLVRLCISGFRLSIDDFGTGYSSLQQLSRVPFSELKVDQSFVAGASERESLRIILESSIQMARKLKLSVTAEGVETQQDWDLLKRLDCDCAQGYFIARPMEGPALVQWARDWDTRR